MLKKTITFEDLDGNEVVEDFYFHLSKAEIIKIHMSKGGEGGYYSHLKRMVDSNDGAELIESFDMFIRNSVGRRSEDGRRFIKSQEITDEFMQSEAYSEMFMAMIDDVDEAVEFINNVFPPSLAKDVEDMQNKLPRNEDGNIIWPELDELGKSSVELDDDAPLWKRENRNPTDAELQEMSQEEVMEAYAWISRKK